MTDDMMIDLDIRVHLILLVKTRTYEHKDISNIYRNTLF